MLNSELSEYSDLEILLIEKSNIHVAAKALEISQSKFCCSENQIRRTLILIRQIIKKNPHLTKYHADLIYNIKINLPIHVNFKNIFLKEFQLSSDKTIYFLYRYLYLNGFFSLEEIYNLIEKDDYNKNIRKSLVILFLPDLSKFDLEKSKSFVGMFNNVQDIFSTNLSSENFNEKFENIISYIINIQSCNSVEYAILTDNVELLETLSKYNNFSFTQKFKPSKFNYLLSERIPLICAAAALGSVECFKFLYLKNSYEENYESSLVKWAIYGNNMEILHILQQHKIKFDGSLGYTAKNFRPTIFEWLISSFPVVMVMKPYNLGGILTELIHNIDYYSILLFFQQDFNLKLLQSESLNFVSLKCNDDIIYKFLFKKLSFNVNQTNLSGNSLLHVVNNEDIASFLYSNEDLNVEVVNKEGFTPLHEYCTKGNLKLAQMYFERVPSSIKAVSNNGLTPLHCASSSGSVDLIKFLLKNGADAMAVDKDKNTPLHYSARTKSKYAVGYLLSLPNINYNTQNLYGDTPFFLAVEYSNADVISLFAQLHDIDINKIDNNGQTALIISINKPNKGIFDYLLSCPDINVNIADTLTKRTPLMHLITPEPNKELTEMFETLLIVNNIDLNARNVDGDTVVHLAIQNNRGDLLKLLLEQKSLDLDQVNATNTVRAAAYEYALANWKIEEIPDKILPPGKTKEMIIKEREKALSIKEAKSHSTYDNKSSIKTPKKSKCGCCYI